MAKMMLHGVEAREALARGVAQLALCVRGTLGPTGLNTIIERPQGTPIVSRDGVSIAGEIDLPDRFENMGAQVVREVSKQTNEVAGDGTTTATILANALIQDGVVLLQEGARPADLVEGIGRAAALIVETLHGTARPVEDAQLDQVAAIAANDAALGRLVADALRRVGPTGIVEVEYGLGVETTVQTIEGMSFDRGYLSHYMITDVPRMRAVLDNPLILLTDRKVETRAQIAHILDTVAGQNRPLLLVADDMASDAVVALLDWNREGKGPAVAVNPPDFGHWRKAMLEDLAVLTGGRVAARDLGIRLETLTLEDLGSARRVLVTQEETAIIGGGGTAEAVKARREQVRLQYDNAPPNVEKDKFGERLAKLAGGTARILVGGATPAEQKRRVQLMDDSVNATRAALEEGIVPGGGTALVHAAPALDALAVRTGGTVRDGVLAMQRALVMPLVCIAENAGFNPAEVVAKVQEAPAGHGFDVRAAAVVDLLATGVIDPVKVTTTAVRNAASAAALILGTNSLVADIPEGLDPRSDPARGGGAELLGRA